MLMKRSQITDRFISVLKLVQREQKVFSRNDLVASKSWILLQANAILSDVGVFTNIFLT